MTTGVLPRRRITTARCRTLTRHTRVAEVILAEQHGIEIRCRTQESTMWPFDRVVAVRRSHRK